MQKCKYFKLYELVSPQVYKKYGETAWQFFDPRLLITIDWIREKLDKSITVNDWKWGGDFDERGLRCNMDPMMVQKTDSEIIYCSPHPFGQGVDFDVEGMISNEVWNWLEDNKEDLPYAIRIEVGENITWVHLDVRNTGVKIYKIEV